MKLWHLFGVLALLAGAGAVASLARLGWPNENTLGAGIGFALFAPIAFLLWRGDRRARALDAAGAVAPNRAGGAGAATADLDGIAADLAAELESFNAVVFRVPDDDELRVMIDPPSSITLDTPQRSMRDDHPAEPTWMGEWWEIRWPPGRAPRVRLRRTAMGATQDPSGRLLPLWSEPPLVSSDERRIQTQQIVSAGLRAAGPADFTFTSSMLTDVVDRISVRSGWVGREALTDPERPEVPLRERVVRRGTDADGGVHTLSSNVSSAEQERIMASLPAEQRELLAMTPQERIARTRSAITAANRGLARVMTIVGGSVLALCVLATIIGLVAGMIWWASFIIIGSGLFLCLVLVLPLRLVAGRST